MAQIWKIQNELITMFSLIFVNQSSELTCRSGWLGCHAPVW